jgi:hypothetical protein
MLHYSNGDVYEGSWVGDQRHGAGTFTSCSSGAIFVGSYCQGLRQGLGTLYMPTKGEDTGAAAAAVATAVAAASAPVATATTIPATTEVCLLYRAAAESL